VFCIPNNSKRRIIQLQCADKLVVIYLHSHQRDADQITMIKIVSSCLYFLLYILHHSVLKLCLSMLHGFFCLHMKFNS